LATKSLALVLLLMFSLLDLIISGLAILFEIVKKHWPSFKTRVDAWEVSLSNFWNRVKLNLQQTSYGQVSLKYLSLVSEGRLRACNWLSEKYSIYCVKCNGKPIAANTASTGTAASVSGAKDEKKSE